MSAAFTISASAISVYTDGSYRNKKGGYGVLILEEGKEIELSGPVPEGFKVTNQTAELTAVIAGLHATKKKDITVYSDSQYCIKCLTKEFQIKANKEIFEVAFELMKGRKVEFVHVLAHTGNKHNERVDKLAKKWT